MTSLMIFALSFGESVVNHFARRYMNHNPVRKKVSKMKDILPMSKRLLSVQRGGGGWWERKRDRREVLLQGG